MKKLVRDLFLLMPADPPHGYGVSANYALQFSRAVEGAPAQIVPMVRLRASGVVREVGNIGRVSRMLRVMAAHDENLHRHSVRVAELAALFAEYLGLGQAHVRKIVEAAFLHDVGKLDVSTNLLNEQEVLSAEGLEKARSHAMAGYKRLQAIGCYSNEVLDAARHHHERMDGSGYPDGLSGEAISFVARFMAVCDVYSALRELRTYHAPRSAAEALQAMREMGNKLDQEFFRRFQRFIEFERSQHLPYMDVWNRDSSASRAGTRRNQARMTPGRKLMLTVAVPQIPVAARSASVVDRPTPHVGLAVGPVVGLTHPHADALYRECSLRLLAPEIFSLGKKGDPWNAEERLSLLDMATVDSVLKALADGPQAVLGCNLSVSTLANAPVCKKILQRILDEQHLAPRLVLGITEDWPLNEITGISSQLAAAKLLGCRLAIHCFAASRRVYWRSLSVDMEWDIVRINRGRALSKDSKDLDELRTLVSRAAVLAPVVVVDGIETPEHLEAARAAGATHGQGALFANRAYYRWFDDPDQTSPQLVSLLLHSGAVVSGGVNGNKPSQHLDDYPLASVSEVN